MSREEILNNIRRGVKRNTADETARQTVLNRLSAKADNLIPARAQLPQQEQVELFIEMANEAAAEIIELDSISEVPGASATWLRDRGIFELVTSSTAKVDTLDWSPLAEKDIQRSQRVARAGDFASLTDSFAGIAETGTLMLHSSPQSPTTLNFLPDNHLVILSRSAIVGVYEEAWKKIRAQFGATLPRTVNMITGPSRSADIEQRLQMGAHGPKTLVIFLIND